MCLVRLGAWAKIEIVIENHLSCMQNHLLGLPDKLNWSALNH